ncbi:MULTISPECIES: TIGR03086 family metal-binding protein [Arthrobacter]|uniref:TIGR03086 family metal-binding protein n=2 Tax=Arthrobacter TaxID=1663 RepID=A0ABU9KHT2_9MICC|nr:TIGR03086 family metal-binding protein [Arthrobacter sp. YJM1]MDP5226547.1 TIGR03086 family metal-binding protein [Arthrobacter sp. YJM1]
MNYTKSLHLPVTPDEAFALVTEPERLRRWQTVVARVDLRLGGEYRWTVTPGHHAVGTFREIEPGKRVVFGFGWEGDAMGLAPDSSTVTVTFTPAGEGTDVLFEHDGLTPEQVPGHTEGWDHFMERLAAAAGSELGAGADPWSAFPQDMSLLNSAEASLAVLLDVLRRVTPDDLDKPTPCSEYTVAQLTDHLAGSLISIGTAVGGTPVDRKDAGLEDRIAGLSQTAVEAFTHRGTDGTVDIAGGIPAVVAGQILNIEFLVHAWDYATACGLPLQVAEELSANVETLARRTITDGVRQGGSFAGELNVSETAGSLERLIAFTGRQPVA